MENSDQSQENVPQITEKQGKRAKEAAPEPIYDAFLYARVSTNDKDQNPENQLRPLREKCMKENLRFKEFIDYESGKEEATVKREAFLQMFRFLDQTKGIMIDKVDRFSRAADMEGMRYAKRLLEKKKYLYVYTDRRMLTVDTPKTEWLDYLVIGFWQAGRELAVLGSRVKRAYELKKAKAVLDHTVLKWGVPSGHFRRQRLDPEGLPLMKPDGTPWYEYVPIDFSQVDEYLSYGYSYRKIAQALGCSVQPIKTYVEEKRAKEKEAARKPGGGAV
jgi:DNA invertase Pin-like site-specific DNA recombinase